MTKISTNETTLRPPHETHPEAPRRCYSTSEFARKVGRQPASIRTAVWRNGHFAGIRPIKTSAARQGRLLWLACEIDALLEKEDAR